MRHLSSESLVSVAEGEWSSSAAAHLDACAACREELRVVKATLASVAEVEVPEPSPLFWEHLSSRIHDAVAAEDAPRRLTWLERLGVGRSESLSSRSPLAAAVAASALAVVVVALTLQIDRDVPGLSGAPDASVASSGSAVDGADSLADDPSLELVAGLAGDLDWDAVKVAGLQPSAGTAEGAVDRLTANERIELNRLLKEVLAKPGA